MIKTKVENSKQARFQLRFSAPVFILLIILMLLPLLSACGGNTPVTSTTASAATTSTRQTPTTVTTASTAAVTTTTGSASGNNTTAGTGTGAATTTINGTLPSATTSDITPSSDVSDIPQLAFIVSVSTTTPAVVQADYVEIYFGDEAVALARQDNYPLLEKDEKGEDYLPNDYYLRNNNKKLRELTLAPDCIIEILPAEGGAEATDIITAAELRDFVESQKRLMELHFDNSGKKLIALTEYFVP